VSLTGREVVGVPVVMAGCRGPLVTSGDTPGLAAIVDGTLLLLEGAAAKNTSNIQSMYLLSV